MPPKIFPVLSDEGLSDLASSAEASFYRACRETLPNNILILHSLSIIDSYNGGPNRVGECDFVVFDPENGVLVVEVKGGGVEYDPSSDGQWYSTNRYGKKFQIKDPFKQSEQYRFRILSLVKEHVRGMKNLHIPVGHSVAFPDISDINPLVSHNRPREIIASSKDLADLKPWYKNSVKFWNRHISKEQKLGKLGLAEIEKALLKPVLARPSLSQTFKAEEQERLKLTDEQLRLTLFLKNHTRANITGGAGTGKTVVAKYLAEQFANQGLKTLFLCFNSALGKQLKSDLTAKERLVVGSYHSFFKNFLDQSAKRYEEEAQAAYPAGDYWTVILPFAYALAAEEGKQQFDAIIIDEAQDLSAESWMAIDLLLADDTSRFFTFSDTNQRFYSNINSIPELSPPFLLYSNCRNTKAIHLAAYKNYQGPEILPPSIEGEAIQVFCEKKLSAQVSIVSEKIRELINIQDLLPEDIMILIADSISKTDKLERLNAQSKKVTYSDLELLQKNQVGVSTIKKFKGLEAPVAIIWGLNEVPEHERRELEYVGISRTKSLCYLVN